MLLLDKAVQQCLFFRFGVWRNYWLLNGYVVVLRPCLHVANPTCTFTHSTLDLNFNPVAKIIPNRRLGYCVLCLTICRVSAIFSEGFTETLGTGVYFQWMVYWNVGYEILFSVNSFTENSDKYSIFSEAFTEMLGSLDAIFSERFTETMHMET